MILQGLLIVLVILICANIGLAVWNKLEPPCATDTKEYFSKSREITHDATKFLTTMQSPLPNQIQNVMPRNGYISKTFDMRVNKPEEPIIRSNKLDPHVATMIDGIFMSTDESSRQVNKDMRRGVAEFDTKMEGLRTRMQASSAGVTNKVSSVIARTKTEREEYKNI
jgi:hypothetical protein